jgi:hypothetical protein
MARWTESTTAGSREPAHLGVHYTLREAAQALPPSRFPPGAFPLALVLILKPPTNMVRNNDIVAISDASAQRVRPWVLEPPRQRLFHTSVPRVLSCRLRRESFYEFFFIIAINLDPWR